MKTIGLLGGMSWESSIEYYRIVNEGVRKKCGGLHSAKIVMYSVDFEPVEKMQHEGRWAAATEVLVDAAQRIERAGADFLVICTNTMHKLADDLQKSIGIPILHIADATAAKIVDAGLATVGLLATNFTMEEDFYKERLTEKHGLRVLVPDERDRAAVHRVIYDELCVGQIRSESREQYLTIIDRLIERGAQAIILGCTEIGLLVKPEDLDVPVFDTTDIHARAAVEKALSD
jgi:aspartate racemase